MISSVNDVNFPDLEDSMQNQAAVSSELDYIVTRNGEDFKGSKIAVVTPVEFIELAHEEIGNV